MSVCPLLPPPTVLLPPPLRIVSYPSPSPRFVSHWWGESVNDFIACLAAHAKDRVPNMMLDSGYWVCAYANNQWCHCVRGFECVCVTCLQLTCLQRLGRMEPMLDRYASCLRYARVDALESSCTGFWGRRLLRTQARLPSTGRWHLARGLSRCSTPMA